MRKIKVAPSILGTKDEALASTCASLINQGADYIHFDVMDGIFVENKSFSPKALQIIKNENKEAFVDAHLMIVNVKENVDAYIKAGASLITFHVEAVSDEEASFLIDYLHKNNVLCGMSIKPNTPASALDKYLEKLDLVLVMSVEPGKGGQSFMPMALDKIAYYASKKSETTHYEIEVDGGINQETGKLCKDAGVDVLVAGSYIMKAESYSEKIGSLR